MVVCKERRLYARLAHKPLDDDPRGCCAVAENPRTGKIIAEKLVRYVEDKIKAKDAMIEKLRLKNVTLRNQIHKVRGRRAGCSSCTSDHVTCCAPSCPATAGIASQL